MFEFNADCIMHFILKFKKFVKKINSNWKMFHVSAPNLDTHVCYLNELLLYRVEIFNFYSVCLNLFSRKMGRNNKLSYLI